MTKHKILYLPNKIKYIFSSRSYTFLVHVCTFLKRDIHVSIILYCIQIFSREMNKFDSYLATRGGCGVWTVHLTVTSC